MTKRDAKRIVYTAVARQLDVEINEGFTLFDVIGGIVDKTEATTGSSTAFSHSGRPRRSNRYRQLPLKVSDRLEELRNLPDGWLDGDGAAPSSEALASAERFLGFLEADVPAPVLYPTPEGGCQAEWSREEDELEVTLCFEPDGSAIFTWSSASLPKGMNFNLTRMSIEHVLLSLGDEDQQK